MILGAPISSRFVNFFRGRPCEIIGIFLKNRERRLRNTSSPCSNFSLKAIGPTWLHDSEMSDNLPFCVVRNGPWMQAARQGRSPCDLASEAARLHRDL